MLKKSTQVTTALWPRRFINRSPEKESWTTMTSSTPQTILELLAKSRAELTNPGAL